MISMTAADVEAVASHSLSTVKLLLSMSPTPLNVPPKIVVLFAPTTYVAQFGIPS